MAQVPLEININDLLQDCNNILEELGIKYIFINTNNYN